MHSKRQKAQTSMCTSLALRETDWQKRTHTHTSRPAPPSPLSFTYIGTHKSISAAKRDATKRGETDTWGRGQADRVTIYIYIIYLLVYITRNVHSGTTTQLAEHEGGRLPQEDLGRVARQRPRPTLRQGCTCWVPTGDRDTCN